MEDLFARHGNTLLADLHNELLLFIKSYPARTIIYRDGSKHIFIDDGRFLMYSTRFEKGTHINIYDRITEKAMYQSKINGDYYDAIVWETISSNKKYHDEDLALLPVKYQILLWRVVSLKLDTTLGKYFSIGPTIKSARSNFLMRT
jgi:hypothetical protein